MQHLKHVQMTTVVGTLLSPEEASDLTVAAAMHEDALPDDVLPSLGRKFLCRYYRLALDAGQGTLLLAMDGGIPQGFLLLTFRNVNPTAAVRAMDLLFFLRHAIKRPTLILSACVQRIKASNTTFSEATAEIALIAVAHRYQGRGVGRALVERAHEVCAQRGVAAIMTKSANAAWIDFYQRNYAATVADSFTVLGKNYRTVHMPVGNAYEPIN